MLEKIDRNFNCKYFNIVLFICMFTIPFILYRDLFAQNMLLAGGDGIGFSTSAIYEQKALFHGEFPLWNKYLSNGVPFIADFGNKGLYPFLLLLDWIPSPKILLYIFYSLHISIGAFFTYLYLKEIGCGKAASICLGLIYLLSIHMGGARKGHLMILVTIIYLPVILYFIEKYIRTRRIKWLLLSSFAMAMQFYAGFIQDVVYTDIVIFIYLLIMGIHYRIEIKKMLVHGCIWFFTYLGLIAIQLLPTLQLLNEYKKLGAEKITYDFFLSYSIHYVKILMMLFPQIFGGDVYQKFGMYNSSGMDIEIFLGVLVFVLIIYGTFRHFDDLRIKIAVFMMAATFVFAAQGHIPVLSKLLYHVPVISGFRCASRILFVFIFFAYVICGIALSKLREKKEFDQFARFVLRFTLGVMLILFAAGIGTLSFEGGKGFPDQELQSIFSYFKNAYFETVIILIAGSFLILILNKIKGSLGNSGYKWAYVLMAAIFLITTVVETYQYTTISNPVSEDVLAAKDYVSSKLAGDIGNYKVWDAFPGLDGGHESIISQNISMAKQIPSINAYISFNNPRLYKLFTQDKESKLNFSGLLTGSVKAQQNLLLQNDLLSMLGVKYIIDNSNLIGPQGGIIHLDGKTSVVFSEPEINIPDMGGELYVYSKEISVKPNTYYNVSFDYNSLGNQQLFYVDLYGGEAYDHDEQQANFTVAAGASTESASFYSGDSDMASPIFLRIVSISTANMVIRNLKLVECNGTMEPGVYIPYIVDENNRIFENTKAKDILYVPQNVKSIQSSNDIYENIFDYMLDKTSYVENFKDIDLSNVKTKIDSIDFRNNSISAKVSSSAPAFVNFSQNYYPGWKAYVNGDEVPVHMVNGLMQGIEIPKGNSTIEFRFTVPAMMLGGIITLLTLLFALHLIRKESKLVMGRKMNEIK